MYNINKEPSISGFGKGDINRIQETFQKRHQRSTENLFYMAGAGIIGLLYYGAFFLLAICIRLLNGRHNNQIAQELGLLHSYVPEMALQKTVEIEALLKMEVSGMGLDLGCGNGFTGSVLMKQIQPLEYHGIDRQAGFKSPLELGYKSLTVGNIEALPYADNTFDFLVAICVVEHIPALNCALKEANRVLKPGGVFIFTVPKPDFSEHTLSYRFYDAIGAKNKATHAKRMHEVISLHYNLLTLHDWSTILRSAFGSEFTIKEIYSRDQALLFDIISLGKRFPDFDFHSIAYKYLYKYPLLNRAVGWAVGEVAAKFASMKMETGQGTLLSICAKKAKTSNVDQYAETFS